MLISGKIIKKKYIFINLEDLETHNKHKLVILWEEYSLLMTNLLDAFLFGFNWV